MAFGIDYVSGPTPAELKATGVTFVCRYLSYVNSLTQVKIMTASETQALSQAGISIVSNYEWYANRALEGFASGVQDAQIAASQHAACGGPNTRPIYFSVDADVDGSSVAAYFKGVASVIGLSRTGAYGSYRVLEYLFNIGDIAWGWQTYAWSGGAWEPRAHIQQYQNGMTLAGHSVDYDRSIKSDFGQWRIGGTMSGIPQGWHMSPDGTALICPSSAPGGPEVEIKGRMMNYVLVNNWDYKNVAMSPSVHRDLLELSNKDLGPGWQQTFRYAMLGIPDTGQHAGEVIWEWTGQELEYLRALYAQAQEQVATMQPLLGKQQQEIADLQAQLKAQPAGLDAAKVKDRLSAIGLASANGNAAIQQLVTQAIA